MQLGIYVVRDTQAKLCHTPVFLKSDVEARRSFIQGVNTKGIQMHDFKNDFELIKIGLYDEVSGQIMVIEPEVIINGGSVKQEEK